MTDAELDFLVSEIKAFIDGIIEGARKKHAVKVAYSIDMETSDGKMRAVSNLETIIRTAMKTQ